MPWYVVVLIVWAVGIVGVFTVQFLRVKYLSAAQIAPDYVMWFYLWPLLLIMVAVQALLPLAILCLPVSREVRERERQEKLRQTAK